MKTTIPRKTFFEEVYEIVQQIPPGKLLTYGKIALLLGKPRCSRMVGQAMFNAPGDRNIPCHRVVNHQGALAPGWYGQHELLLREGVTFRKNGCADLRKHLWDTEELLEL